MSKFSDDYRMTHEEIEELRQDTKNALKSSVYLLMMSQIKLLDLSEVRVSGTYTYITQLPLTVPNKPR